MFLLLGLIIGAFSLYEAECPLDYSYYLDVDGEITDCSWSSFTTEGCYELDSEMDCTDTCMYGYYWNDVLENCYDCAYNGMICEGDGEPTACYDGWYLDTSLSYDYCEECYVKFDDCALCTEAACTTCDVDAALYDGECFDCDGLYDGEDSDAATCSYDGEEITVLTCDGGYALMSDGTYPYCAACTDVSYTGYDAAATSCVEGASGELDVTSCSYGYCLWDDAGVNQCYLTSDYEIYDCTWDGEVYTATECASTYDTCLDGEGNTGCYYCGGGMDWCTFTDTVCDTVDTYACMDEGMMYVDDGEDTCEYCHGNCATCAWDGEYAMCSACMDVEMYEDGYYVDTDGEYDECVTCGTYCHECMDGDVCDTCVSIYGMEECYELPVTPDDNDDTDDDASVAIDVNALFF